MLTKNLRTHRTSLRAGLSSHHQFPRYMSAIEIRNTLHQFIDKTANTDLLQWISSVLKESESVYHLTPEERSAVEESMSEYAQGNVQENDDVIKETNQWLDEFDGQTDPKNRGAKS